MNGETKTCNKCGETKPTTEYRKRRGTCKTCQGQQIREWNEANKDHIRERNRRWREANKDRLRQQDCQYREANRDRARERNRQWYQANRSHQREQQRQWYEANKEKVALNTRRRKRNLQAAAFTVTETDLKRLRTAPCLACGATENLTLEHLIPLSRGGTHAIGNLATLCQPCNDSKHNLTWTEWKYSNRPIARRVFDTSAA